MTILKIKLSLVLFGVAVCAYGQDAPIPIAAFSEIVINLTFPQYRALKSDGGFIEVDGGVRGIIVYREDAETFVAFERNCPYQPEDACARIEPDLSRLFLIDRCCGSTFNFSDGYPTKGPSSRALRKYRISMTGSTLTITDEIVF